MKWGMNARRLEGQPYGMGRYVRYLIKYWQQMVPPTDEVDLFIRAPLGEEKLHLASNFHIKHLRPRLTGIVWENTLLWRQARKLDVLFCPNYSIPLARSGPCVVAIHGVDELRPGAWPWWYHYTYRQLYRLSGLKAARVIAPTEATKKDIVEAYRIPAEKIEVIPQGADETFRPLDDPELLRATRIKYLGEDRPYIVFVGQLSQRRNISTLVRAFALAKKRLGLPHSLLLFGRNNIRLPLQELAAELGIPGSVVQTDGIIAHHSELAPVYNAADLYVTASLSEGFSITVAEALACGLPVIVTNCPALREMVDGYGFIVEEPSAEAIAEAIGNVLTDTALRQRLRAGSLERAKVYRWDDVARRTLNVLRQAAAS